MPYRWRCGEGNGMLIISSSSISFNNTKRSSIEEREKTLLQDHVGCFYMDSGLGR